MNIQIEALGSFVAAVDTGSFSAAARRLGKSQATISTTIQNLEIDLGFTLFDRTGKYPELTQKGCHVLKNARRLVTQYNTFVENSLSINLAEAVSLSIGIDAVVCDNNMVDVLNRFSQQFPSIELNILQHGPNELSDLLLKNQIDFAVGVFLNPRSSEFETTPISEQRGCWVASPSFWNFSDNKLTKERIQHVRLMLPREIDPIHLIELKHSTQNWRVEHLNTLLSFCRSGMGIAYMPEFVVSNDITTGKLIKLKSCIANTRGSSWQVSLRTNLKGKGNTKMKQWLIDEISTLKPS